MKRFLICAFVAFTISCVAACCGFSEVEAGQEEMFVEVYAGEGYRIVYNKDNKVMYSVSHASHNLGNFTLLVNPDGTPMVWEG